MSEPQVHENRERNKNRDCSWPGVVEVLYRFPTGRADQPLRLGALSVQLESRSDISSATIASKTDLIWHAYLCRFRIH